MNRTPQSAGSAPGRVEVSGLWFDALPEQLIVDRVREAWSARRGGSIVPVNVDVALAAHRKPELAKLIDRATLVVADGMPLIWTARLQGNPLPERVTGSSLVQSLSAAAAVDGKSVYLFGGAKGVPERAAEALRDEFENLRVAGTQSPEFGFDQTEEGTNAAVATARAAAPDLVFVGLGFPRQEVLIEKLRRELPTSWFLACGGGITMAAGSVRRASPFVQRLGLEWLHRLALEPRRLARRYLRDDLPFAIRMLGRAAVQRMRRHFT